MEIKDLAGLSQPLTRLIEVVSSGIGAVSQPYLIKKMAEARAHEVRVIAGALREVADEHHLPVVYQGGEVGVWQKPEDKTLIFEAKTPDERAALRVDFQERKRQHNVESITAVAAAELADATGVPDEKPDEDWVNRFFSSAQDVSSRQMQELWGRILAGEIKCPGQYSLKTLDFVRNLTKADAALIEQFGALAINYATMAFVAAQDRKWLQEKRSIYAGHHFSLGELGAVYPTDLQIRLFREESIQEEVLFHRELVLVIKRGEIKSEVQIPVWKFTNIGKELLALLSPSNDTEYLTKLGQFIVAKKGVVTLGKVINRLPDGRINYQIISQLDKDPQ